MVNLHFSLLPRWRGAAPVERAILAGDRETGVCLMKVEEGWTPGRSTRHGSSRSPTTSRWPTCARTGGVGSARRRHIEGWGGGAARPAAAAGRCHRRGEDHSRGSAPALGAAGTTDGAGGAARPGLDDVPRPAPRRTGRGPRRGRRRSTRATRHAARRVWCRPVRARCCCGRVQPESRSPMSADEWLRGVRPEDGERLGTD